MTHTVETTKPAAIRGDLTYDDKVIEKNYRLGP